MATRPKVYKLVKETSQARYDTRKFSNIPKFYTTVESQAAQTYYVSLNEYINIHMDKLMR